MANSPYGSLRSLAGPRRRIDQQWRREKGRAVYAAPGLRVLSHHRRRWRNAGSRAHEHRRAARCRLSSPSRLTDPARRTAARAHRMFPAVASTNFCRFEWSLATAAKSAAYASTKTRSRIQVRDAAGNISLVRQSRSAEPGQAVRQKPDAGIQEPKLRLPISTIWWRIFRAWEVRSEKRWESCWLLLQ